MKGRPRSLEERIRILESVLTSGNVRAGCRVAGIARSSFYELKRAYDREGREGLQPKPRRKPRMANAFSEAIIAKILEVTGKFPSYSSQRVALKLRGEGVTASGSGVRKIWKRHGLTTRSQREEWVDSVSLTTVNT